MFVPWELEGMWRMVAYCRRIIDNPDLQGRQRYSTCLLNHVNQGPTASKLSMFSFFDMSVMVAPH
jgi:hypothetical protein